MANNIVFGKVLTITPLFGGCGIRSVTCMGNAQMLVIFEEVGGPAASQIQMDISAGPSGTGYVIGDTGKILGGNQDALYVIDAVGAGGSVATFHLTATGTFYSNGASIPTQRISGGGNGWLVSIATSGGAIVTLETFAGSGYAVGDTGTIDGGIPAGSAAYKIDFVTSLGGVDGFHLTAAGHGYVAHNVTSTTPTSGSGSGFLVDILSVPVGVYPQRGFRSSDNGVTWTELPYFPSKHNLWLWGSYSPAMNTVLVGNEGPDLCDPPSTDDAIARTTNGGLSWQKAVQDDVIVYDCTETFDIHDFVPLDANEIWAVGSFGPFASSFQYLVSTNSGALFPTSTRKQLAAAGSVSCGVYCGSNIVVLGGTLYSGASQNARVWRTTNRGVSWTQILLPNTQHAAFSAATSGTPTSMVYLGGGIVLACGTQAQAAGYFPPKLWRSIDSGATWTEITDSLPSWTTGQQVPAATLVDLGNGRVGLGISGRPDKLGNSNWRLSEDFGVTWSVCTATAYTDPLTTFVSIVDMAVADDGAVAVTLTGSQNEVWRGVPAGFSSVGPCAALLPTSCPAPLANVLLGDYSAGNVRQIFSGEPTDDGSLIPWQLLPRPVSAPSPQMNAYYRRLVVKAADVVAAQTIAVNVVFGPVVKNPPRQIAKTLTVPVDVPLGLNGMQLNAEVDLTMDLGLIATNARAVLSGTGLIRLRGLEWHVHPKPLRRASLYP